MRNKTTLARKLTRFQIEHWSNLALKTPDLRAVLDPHDSLGNKNSYIDYVHKRIFRKIIPASKNQVVLDFGCGVGRILKVLAKKCSRVVGVDTSLEMIKVAANKIQERNADFIIINGLNLPFKSSTFDCVVSVWVLQHAVNRDDLDSILGEISRVMKPGGKFFLIEQVSHSQEYLEEEMGYRILRTEEEYLRKISKHGFVPDAYRAIRLKPFSKFALCSTLLANFIFLGRFLAFPVLFKLDCIMSNRKKSKYKGYLDYFFSFTKEKKAGPWK